MVKSYESLMGAVGRSVFYRPDRQRVRELLSRDANPMVLIEGHHFPVFDISMNGVSFLLRDVNAEWRVGHELSLSLLLYDEEVYRGAARVARIEQGTGGVRVALGLVSGFLDLPEMRRRDDEKKLERSLSMGPQDVEKLIPAEYLAVVGRVAHFFQFHRRSLDYHEERLRSEGAGDADLMELAQRAVDGLYDARYDLESQASRVASTFLGDRNVVLAAKEYTETVLVPLIRDIPHDSRAYFKPLGYPGDYQMMLYYYNMDFEGTSLFSKVMHRLSVDHPLAVGVRGRKDLIIDLIGNEHRRLIALKGKDADFKVVGLGCGPAREVSEYIAKVKVWPGSIGWTLIDPEEKALSVAFRASQHELSRTGSKCHLHLLNLSFVQMLSEGLPLRGAGSQDFIYAAGVFDYLRAVSARKLLRAMYDLVAPGGAVAVGNALAPNEFFFSPGMMTDWNLIYRTGDEMQALGALLPEDAEVEILTETTGAFYFLLARKPLQPA